MRKLLTLRWYILPISIVVISNGSILASVLINRNGEVDSQLKMSEREWHLVSDDSKKESNAMMSLRLNWRVFTNSKQTLESHANMLVPVWLTDKKLTELGFDLHANPELKEPHYIRDKATRNVYLVAEYNGKIYRSMLSKKSRQMEKTIKRRVKHPTDVTLPAKVKSAQIGYNSELQFNSRLFIVDAGLDRASLREKYPDRSVYAIMKGEISSFTRTNQKSSKHYTVGYINKIHANTLHVPLEFRSVFTTAESPKNTDSASSDGLVGNATNINSTSRPRYSVSVAYGENLDAWITQANKIQ